MKSPPHSPAHQPFRSFSSPPASALGFWEADPGLDVDGEFLTEQVSLDGTDTIPAGRQRDRRPVFAEGDGPVVDGGHPLQEDRGEDKASKNSEEKQATDLKDTNDKLKRLFGDD